MLITCQGCSKEIEGKINQKYCCKKCGDKHYGSLRKEQKAQYDKVYRANNLDKQHHWRVNWRKQNKEKRYATDKARIIKNPKLKYYKNILTLLKRFLRDGYKYSKTLDYLPFTLEELRERLVSTLPEGFSIEDYFSAKLHIDHIKPHRDFNYTHHSQEEFKRCWSLSNLRLLPATINISSLKKQEYDKRG